MVFVEVVRGLESRCFDHFDFDVSLNGCCSCYFGS
jgi:hypothetical protein